MNTNVSELTRATERPEAISMRVPVDNPSKTKTEEIWNENYSKYGVAFGSERSQTAVNLIEAFRAANGINRRKTVVDVGCGTGRDAIEYALQGYEVTGVDLARSGLELAFQEYCVVQQRHPISGVARFLQGDIETAFANIVGNFDGISSHRTLHLMQRGQLKRFAECAAKLLEPHGFISIGARSPKDFKPDEMEWIKKGEVAKYKSADRAGHKLHFISANLLEEIFRKDFNILSISEGTEPERIGRDVNANLIFMFGRKKSNASIRPTFPR